MQIFDLSKKFPVEERYSLRELHKKMICLQQRFAIQWYLARPCIISGLFGPHYKKFWDIF
jgi:hypothetical protein